MSAKKSGELGHAPSMAAAASICGITRAAIRCAKKAGCPAVHQSGRVDCDGLMAWLATHPDILIDAGGMLNRDIETVRKIRAERLLKEHSLGERRGEFVASTDVERDVASMIQTAKSVLLSGPSSLAPQVVGVSVQEAEQILREWLHHALSQLSGDPLGRKQP